MQADSVAVRRLFFVETLIAFLILSLPALPQLIAYGLDINPTSTSLWWALLTVNHFTQNISMLRSLAQLDGISTSIAILLVVASLALHAIVSRSIFTTALLGHTAVAFGIIMLATGLGLFKLGRHVADLSQWTFVGYFPVENSALSVMFVVLLACCAINHIIYVRLCASGAKRERNYCQRRLGLLAK
ncbi:MAG: hypothetical protein KGO53_00935 [Alphaproteobacteria bacterium]|nr:hypothetical protein [Alphaproteobacteria bacterium]